MNKEKLYFFISKLKRQGNGSEPQGCTSGLLLRSTFKTALPVTPSCNYHQCPSTTVSFLLQRCTSLVSLLTNAPPHTADALQCLCSATLVLESQMPAPFHGITSGRRGLTELAAKAASERGSWRKNNHPFPALYVPKSITFGLQPLAASNQSTLTRAQENCWLEESFVK